MSDTDKTAEPEHYSSTDKTQGGGVQFRVSESFPAVRVRISQASGSLLGWAKLVGRVRLVLVR